jgi:hypothetical protein
MSRLETVRHELLTLHRALLDAQRIAHEREHGKVTAGAFLELVIGAPEFAWLRPLTALIVGIDEAIDEANPDSARARRLALIAAKKAALPGAADSAPGERSAQPPEAAVNADSAASTEALYLADTRKLLTLDAELGDFQRHYAAALHDTPEIVIAHASVLRALALPAAPPR